ncbi:MAG: hypothetical protein WC867_00450 [Candidatus Pacearchaeota archaeon]|jgi:hypothetical protein
MKNFRQIKDYLIKCIYHPVDLGMAKSEDYLRYFSGGYSGVKRRVGDFVRKEVKGLSFEERSSRAILMGLDFLFFERILSRNYRYIDGNFVSRLPLLLNYEIDNKKMFGVPKIPPDDRRRIVQKLRNEDIFLGGTKIDLGELIHSNLDEVDLESVVDVYVTFLAIEEL